MRRETIIKDLVISAVFMKFMILATPTAAGDIKPDVVEIPDDPIVYQFLDIVEETPVDEFIEAVGMLESDNTYYVVNRYGMLGKYQFSPTTIQHLGYDVTKEDFLTNPPLQDSVMRAYMRDNYNMLHPYIARYGGRMYKGVYINTATVLAGAHFAGAGGMKRFFEDPEDSVGVTDGNGMTLVRYMNHFDEYKLAAIE